MSRIYVQSEYVIPATPEEVYASLIDFENARPSILTSNFVDYIVEQGGMGEGTVIRYQLQAAGRKRDYRHTFDDASCITELDKSGERGRFVAGRFRAEITRKPCRNDCCRAWGNRGR